MASNEDDAPTDSGSDEEYAQFAQPPAQHIMLSYQWDNQKLVEDIYMYLKKAQETPVWMDKHGGMKENIFDSMSDGVQNCSTLICFLSPAYQNSANCKRELTYALNTGAQVIPCIIGSKEQGIKWKPSDWLGMSISGLLYLDFSQINDKNFQSKCQELLQRISPPTNSP